MEHFGNHKQHCFLLEGLQKDDPAHAQRTVFLDASK